MSEASKALAKENHASGNLLRHFEALWGYTREAVQKAIDDIELAGYDKEDDIGALMLQRKDELTAHLKAIQEALE